MKVECVKDKLKDNVLYAERITGKNLTLPILSAILLIAEGKTLKIRATNLELGIEVEVPAKVEVEGAVAVPGAVGGLAAIYALGIRQEQAAGQHT
jgi:DNA polymerase III subunit beta